MRPGRRALGSALLLAQLVDELDQLDHRLVGRSIDLGEATVLAVGQLVERRFGLSRRLVERLDDGGLEVGRGGWRGKRRASWGSGPTSR